MTNAILEALRARDYCMAVRLTQDWIATATYKDICNVVRSLEATVMRERLACLVGDVLSLSANSKWGIPVLMRCTSDTRCPIVLPHHGWPVVLPTGAPPPAGWLAYHWRPPRADPQAPFATVPTAVSVTCNEIAVAVLVLELDDANPTEIRDPWWSDLFLGLADTTVISARMMLPWPAAAEAAELMLTGALGKVVPPEAPLFLAPDAAEFARQAGQEFAAAYGQGGPL